MTAFSKAAQAISNAKGILIATGAGMGVDSGLPDFRGNEGFWKAYPPFQKRGLSFYDLANPRWFTEDPTQAWGFYGHRFNLYAATKPNAGFAILKRWGDTKPCGSFVYTSNVDCHFQASGFDNNRIVECHGSFQNLQCSAPCGERTWSAEDLKLEVDESSMLAIEPLPKCDSCEAVARPNILMFGDGQWIGTHTAAQEDRFNSWIMEVPRSDLVVIEIGAGTAVPTVRRQTEFLMQRRFAKLIRINPRESQGPEGTISIPCGGLEALQKIDELLSADS